jgi:hypothetical protein
LGSDGAARAFLGAGGSKDQGLHGILADQQLRFASAAASIGLQVTRKAILIYFSGVLSGHRVNLDGKGSIFMLLLEDLMPEQRKSFFSSKPLSAFVLIESDRVEEPTFSPGNVHRLQSPPLYAAAVALAGGPSYAARARRRRRAHCRG